MMPALGNPWQSHAGWPVPDTSLYSWRPTFSWQTVPNKNVNQLGVGPRELLQAPSPSMGRLSVRRALYLVSLRFAIVIVQHDRYQRTKGNTRHIRTGPSIRALRSAQSAMSECRATSSAIS